MHPFQTGLEVRIEFPGIEADALSFDKRQSPFAKGSFPQRDKNLKLSGQQLFTRKNFPDEARKYTSRDI